MTEDIRLELHATFKYNTRRWKQIWGDDMYHTTETVYIQPSYKLPFVKGPKGNSILTFIVEDDDIILNKKTWDNTCECVRNDFIDYFFEYAFWTSNINLYDEHKKKEKSHYKFLENAFSQRDVSNYLTVHENKQVVDDVSNHILSFL